MTKDELIEILKKYDVQFKFWGTGQAKTLDHLLSEIELGETRLVEKNNKLYREAPFATINVFYQKNDQKYKLLEDRQIFKDGRVAIRNVDSLLEKLKPNEKPLIAAKRALQEELGISTEIEIKDLGNHTDIVEALGFPTLVNCGISYDFEVYLPDSEYKPDGYREIQVDKTSYFKWRKD